MATVAREVIAPVNNDERPRVAWSMASDSEPIVRRKCQQCGTRNWTEAASVNARLRCANCGALLYPEENPGYVPQSAVVGGEPPDQMPGWLSACASLGKGMFVVLALGAALALGWKLLASGNIPLASYSVSDIRGTDQCSGLLDYCVRVTCTVTNEGPVRGQASVELQLDRGRGKPPLSHTERVPLGVGERKTVSHDFKNARLFDKNPSVECDAR